MADSLIDQLQQALAMPQQPGFMGLSAPPNPQAMQGLLANLQGQQYANAMPAGSFQQMAANVGNNLGGQVSRAIAPPQTPGPIEQAISAGRAQYGQLIQSGMDPDEAGVQVAKGYVQMGIPGADVILQTALKGQRDKLQQTAVTDASVAGAANTRSETTYRDGVQTQNTAAEAIKNAAETMATNGYKADEAKAAAAKSWAEANKLTNDPQLEFYKEIPDGHGGLTSGFGSKKTGQFFPLFHGTKPDPALRGAAINGLQKKIQTIQTALGAINDVSSPADMANATGVASHMANNWSRATATLPGVTQDQSPKTTLAQSKLDAANKAINAAFLQVGRTTKDQLKDLNDELPQPGQILMNTGRAKQIYKGKSDILNSELKLAQQQLQAMQTGNTENIPTDMSKLEGVNATANASDSALPPGVTVTKVKK